MKAYTEWSYLYPPRPESAVPHTTLDFYERTMQWVAQYKKNGTNTIIGISPDKKFIAMNRHNDNHKTWQLTDHIKKELAAIFSGPYWYVICAEILHLKTPMIKDTIYIYDILVFESRFLYGSKFSERQKILDPILTTERETESHYVCDSENKIWYAKLINKDFKKIFWEIKDPAIDEGLVLKDPNGKLLKCDKPTSNSGWQAKCRYQTKNYQF